MEERVVPDEPDVCIVGAGPAGLTVAQCLGEAGRQVVILESGSGAGTANGQELNDGDAAGEPYVGLIDSRHRGIGGTVNIWNVRVGGRPGAKYVPLSPRDLVDWPLAWSDLERAYIAAQGVCGLGPFEYGSEHWAAEGRRPFDLDGTALGSGVYQFGFGARFTADVPQLLDPLPNVLLQPSTTVVDMRDLGSERPTVIAVDAAGRSVRIKPRALVLACGAIENARLLLAAGCGTSLPWLGEGFMEHARDFSLSMQPARPELFAAAGFYDLHEVRHGHLVGGRLTFTDEALDAGRLPNASMTLFPRPRLNRGLPARLRRAITRRGDPRLGPYGWSDGATDGSAWEDFKVILNMEQRPERSNRVLLSDRTDRFGNRLPRLELVWSSRHQAALERLRRLADESLREAGVGRLVFEAGRRPDLSAHHHAGTTRMAEAPADGVVDSAGRLFRSDRVFLAGASVFPGAGFANPTLTIVAMAIRLGHHVDRVLG